MWAYILRKLLYNVPVYLGIVLFVMLALRVNDPVYAYLGKAATEEMIQEKRKEMGLNRPFLIPRAPPPAPEDESRSALGWFRALAATAQYSDFLVSVLTLDFSERGWDDKRPVGELLRSAIGPSLAITIPALMASAAISIAIGLIAAFYRGRTPDKLLVFMAVLGMSISFLVYIIFGQYWGAHLPRERWGIELFATQVTGTVGANDVLFFFRPQNWVYYCMLPVMISVIVTMGYDTRYYRAVMVEESGRDYIVTAKAKGATRRKVMFVHMLKNAMIPIITRIMITLPFLIAGSILLEMYFNIPGMGRTLINAIHNKDFPVIQAFSAVLAAVFIVSNILTDVLYALVDPRVRLQ